MNDVKKFVVNNEFWKTREESHAKFGERFSTEELNRIKKFR